MCRRDGAVGFRQKVYQTSRLVFKNRESGDRFRAQKRSSRGCQYQPHGSSISISISSLIGMPSWPVSGMVGFILRDSAMAFRYTVTS